MAGNTDRTDNMVPTLVAKSNAGDNADVQVWADPATHRLLVNASVTVGDVSGSLTNNNAAPGADNLGVLPAVANAAAPSYTEGRQVLLSTDLTGALRVTGSLSVGGFTDDAAFTAGATTGSITMAVYDDTAPDSVNEGDGGALRMSANRNLYVMIRDAAGNERGLNIDANGALALGSIVPGTGATNLGKAEDAAHTTGDTGVFTLAVRNDANATRTSTDGDYSPISVDLAGNTTVVGNIAHDTADAGAPVKIGGQARTTNPTAVADADRVNATYDKLGKQIVVGSIRDLKANQVTTITASTSETTIVTAVASTFLDLYGLIVTNTSATAVNVAIKDATAGTTRLNIAVPAGETRGFMLPEGGAIKQNATNNNWTATVSASVSSIIITALTVANT